MLSPALLRRRPRISLNNNNNAVDDADTTTCAHYVSKEAVTFAEAYAAELIALRGPQFDDPRTTLGVGGLDDVIAEIKRRVWVPLAAPPSVMHELGITPVRGMILCKSSRLRILMVWICLFLCLLERRKRGVLHNSPFIFLYLWGMLLSYHMYYRRK